ncbi:hypothetical protein IMG5_046640 [Ichthyophthirius multifiliis]|uniref:Uncharacterized protein n=1 Tax=Ichthyophthirius multifiliis TaxID=5932 RepID=G0QM89_ICHMU|nr:hypothetical protein IMG5_046640 [Ichthyophthirius multifiliis]EGR33664.1 hypothetical protein IMG5_046640 [Ichthyophthirius multifiliis]|eukprot:XP_004037650.1 hypothetical protein IMG5_046640 [Ichthyophthirius multifiliis]
MDTENQQQNIILTKELDEWLSKTIQPYQQRIELLEKSQMQKDAQILSLKLAIQKMNELLLTFDKKSATNTSHIPAPSHHIPASKLSVKKKENSHPVIKGKKSSDNKNTKKQDQNEVKEQTIEKKEYINEVNGKKEEIKKEEVIEDPIVQIEKKQDKNEEISVSLNKDIIEKQINEEQLKENFVSEQKQESQNQDDDDEII